MGRRFVVVGVAAALACAAPLIAAPPAGAATFAVTSGADDSSEGTLRWAVAQAVATPGDDVVVVDPSVTAITLDDCGAGRVAVAPPNRITIEGGGTTITQTCPAGVIGGAGDLVLRDLTLTGGNSLDEGGGVSLNGTLSLERVTVTANAAPHGGAGVMGVVVSLTDSIISGNTGQGVTAFTGGSLTVTRSSIVENTSGGIGADAPVELVDSEVSRNTGVEGGGVSINDNGSLTARRSRIEDNDVIGDGGGVYSVGPVDLIDTVVLANRSHSGGGIWSEGDVHVTRSAIRGNVASSEVGGVVSLADLAIVESSVAQNEAGNVFGGAYGAGETSVDRSTIEGNVSGTSWAGVAGGDVSVVRSAVIGNRAAEVGAGVIGHRVTIDTSTVSGNVAADGGGVMNNSDVTIRNATIVENAPVNVVVASGFDVSGSVIALGATADCDLGLNPVSSQGYNFGGDTSCGFDQTTDRNGGGDPLLSPLAPHEGPTENRVPESGSPLLNAIPSSDARCTGTDQRGFARPANGACDIGAVEVRQVSAVSTSVTTPFETAVATDLRPLVTDPDLVLSNYQVTPPANGSLDPEDGGVVTYHPDTGFSGADAYTYVVCSTGDVICTSVETVSITVLAGPVAAATPVAATPTFTG